MMTSKNWCQLAWQAISMLPGETPQMLRAQWDAHADREKVVVTLFGPYDSGKSSLLKRLLVDDGKAVPDWLTISARPETFEANEIEVSGVVVIDTPGAAGGNEKHDLAANDALSLSDMIMLVLPPQMVTSAKGTFANVLAGSHFCCGADVAYTGRGLAVVLNRMDGAGASPEDDPEGYAALKATKATEFDAFLRGAGGIGEVVSLLMTAADPYGLVGNSMPVDRSAYDIGRSWDGIDSFAGFLCGLPDRKHELRQHAEIRFLGVALGEAAKMLQVMRQERHVAMVAADGESRMHALAERRLTELLGAAQADLNRSIDEEVEGATRRGETDLDNLKQIVGDRMDVAVARWASNYDAAIDTFLQDFDHDLMERRERPAAKSLWNLPDDSDETRGKSGDTRKGRPAMWGKMKKLTAALHKGFREIHSYRFGMTIQKSRDELQRLGKAASFKEYVKETGKKAVRFRDVKQADSAKWSARVDAGFAAAAPAILELGSLVMDISSEQRNAKELTDRRAKARYGIEASKTEMAAEVWKWWCDEGLPAAAAEGLKRTRQAAEEVRAALAAEVESIESVLKSVDDCLDRLCAIGESHRGFGRDASPS